MRWRSDNCHILQKYRKLGCREVTSSKVIEQTYTSSKSSFLATIKAASADGGGGGGV